MSSSKNGERADGRSGGKWFLLIHASCYNPSPVHPTRKTMVATSRGLLEMSRQPRSVLLKGSFGDWTLQDYPCRGRSPPETLASLDFAFPKSQPWRGNPKHAAGRRWSPQSWELVPLAWPDPSHKISGKTAVILPKASLRQGEVIFVKPEIHTEWFQPL